MLEAAVNWAKEYGDVLGTVGFLFAMTTVMLTNGKVILQRLRGDAMHAVSPDALSIGAGNYTARGTEIIDAPPIAPEYGDKIPIAVLPPMERGEHEDHFAAGLADDIVADLQRALFATPDLRSVEQLVNAGADTRRIARDLNVNHVLTSSIRRQEDKIRVSIQLIDPTGAVLWSDRYNAEGDDLMAIQEHIAERVGKDVAAVVKPGVTLRDPETGKAFKTRDEALTALSSPKSRLVALLLAVPPLGLFGAHRFYVGRPFTGILYFLTGGMVLFGAIIDVVIISMGMLADGKGRPVRFWRPDPLKHLKTP